MANLVVDVALGVTIAVAASACSGSAGHPPAVAAPTTTARPAATTSTAATPAEISAALRRTVEVQTPSENFATRVTGPVVTSDGKGGTLTAVLALRHPSADGKGMLVFFWHDHQFVGWDSHQEATLTSRLVVAGPAAFRITYANYAKNDAACCPSLPPAVVTYHWNAAGRFTPDAAIPPGVYDLNNPYAHPVKVSLR